MKITRVLIVALLLALSIPAAGAASTAVPSLPPGLAGSREELAQALAVPFVLGSGSIIGHIQETLARSGSRDQ